MLALANYYQPDLEKLIPALVWESWQKGASREEILKDSEGMSRGNLAIVQLTLDEIEKKYRPSQLEIQAYATNLYRRWQMENLGSEDINAIAQAERNQYLRQVAQKAANVIRSYEARGISTSGSFEDKEDFEIVDVQDVFSRKKVSCVIFGNSGAGKSSVAKALASELSFNQPIQAIVVDRHLNDWGNIPIVSDWEDILRTLHFLVEELDRRQENWKWQVENLPPEQRSKDWSYLLIIWDEIGATLSYANKGIGKDLIKAENLYHPSDVLLRLGSEIRKFNGCFIGLNQSGNCAAIGIDSNYRSNFTAIHLCESAIAHAKAMPKNNPVRKFIMARRKGYPCLVDSQAALHPTHHQYDLFREGNVPASFPEPKIEPLTLDLPCRPLVYQGTLKDAFQGSVVKTEEKKILVRAKPIGLQIDPEPTSDQLLGIFKKIREIRSENESASMSDVCSQLGVGTKDSFDLYKQALDEYAHLWIEEEFISDGELNVRYQDVIQIVWGFTSHKRYKKTGGYQAACAKLIQILSNAQCTIPEGLKDGNKQ